MLVTGTPPHGISEGRMTAAHPCHRNYFSFLNSLKKLLLKKFYFVFSSSLTSCSGFRIWLKGGKIDRGLCVDEIKPHPKIIFFTEQLIFLFFLFPLMSYHWVHFPELTLPNFPASSQCVCCCSSREDAFVKRRCARLTRAGSVTWRPLRPASGTEARASLNPPLRKWFLKGLPGFDYFSGDKSLFRQLIPKLLKFLFCKNFFLQTCM